jgi:hypothetical protein
VARGLDGTSRLPYFKIENFWCTHNKCGLWCAYIAFSFLLPLQYIYIYIYTYIYN